MSLAARVPETDALVLHLEGAADLPEGVQEGHHLQLAGAADVDVAPGGQRRAGPGSGLQAVRQRAVGVAAQLVDAGDQDGPVGAQGDDRAHLLQHADQVDDLRLDGRVAQLGDALGEDGGEQHLLGRADRGVGQLDLGAAQALLGDQVGALRVLLDGGAELAQHLEVEVDRTAADVAAAQARDEGVAEAVQQRAAEQDRDPRGARVRVDVGDVRTLHVRRVEDQLAVLVAGPHGDPVQLEQSADHLDVADVRDVAQSAGALAEEGGDHGLGHQVLRTADADLAFERVSAVDQQDVVGHRSRNPGCQRSGKAPVESRWWTGWYGRARAPGKTESAP